VIKRFRPKGLEAFFQTGSTRGINPQFAPKLRRVLTLLSEGPLPDAVNLPGYRLHQLKGDRKGEWALWYRATGARYSKSKAITRPMSILSTTINLG
jgi:proteic killer suppression protein